MVIRLVRKLKQGREGEQRVATELHAEWGMTKAKILDTTVCEGEGTGEPWEAVEHGRDAVRWHFR